MADKTEQSDDRGTLITFRCPEAIAEAADAAAARELISRSGVVRRALVRDLRAAGLLAEAV